MKLIKSGKQIKMLSAIAICMMLITVQSATAQYAQLPGKNKGKPMTGPVKSSRENSNKLTNSKVQIRTEAEQTIIEQMERLKKDEATSEDEILNLQNQLEKINGATSTSNASESFCRMIPPDGRSYPNSSVVYDGFYVACTSIQVEQRGTNAGRIWAAIGVTDADTGAGASSDTLILFYSDNGGDSYTQYVKTVFSPANKINFDDLDMEIFEPASGDKYIYMVFGYTTSGYFGQNLIGYTIVRTPTLAVFGSTFNPPGFNSSNKYTRPKISSDNSRYASVPYAFITYVQDSTDGSFDYSMSKQSWILSPYNMNPFITYVAAPLFTIAGPSVNTGMCMDLAYFHNGSDSLIYCLSEAPNFLSNIYTYTINSNTPGNPTFVESFTPSGSDLQHARIATNGGFNQLKVAIIYSENYNNSGDWDQYVLRTSDRINWTNDNFEFSSVYNSRQGEIIGRRNSDGSFSLAFHNVLGSLQNMTYATYSGNFSVSNYTHRANPDYANSLCSPKPAFRYVSGDSCYYNWNYFYTARSSNECSDIGLYLSYAIEGFYDEVNGVHNILDVVYVYLADPNPPHNYVDTAVMYLDHQLFLNEAAFYNAPAGSYYVVVKHRNALQTWSAAPVSIDDNPGFYDFTAASTNAFGDNMTLKGARWCLFSGDVNQDETIDGTDLQEIDNDAYNFIFGQLLNTDLNGDDFVDGGDYLLADNNAANFISLIRP